MFTIERPRVGTTARHPPEHTTPDPAVQRPGRTPRPADLRVPPDDRPADRTIPLAPDDRPADRTIPLAPDDDDPGDALRPSHGRSGGAADQALPDAHGGDAWPPPASLDAPVMIEAPRAARGYWGNVLSAILFPSSPHNLIIFAFLVGMLAVRDLVLVYAYHVGWLGQGIITGWYAAFRFGVIVDAASGDEDLPDLSLSEGVYYGIVRPFVQWIGSWAVVMLPAIACLVILLTFGTGGSQSMQPGELIDALVSGEFGALFDAGGLVWATVALMLAGLFMWPIVVLCIAMGGFATLRRLDLVVATVVRTLGPYLLTVAFVFGSRVVGGALQDFIVAGPGAPVGPTAGSSPASSAGGGIVAAVVCVGVAAYVEIVALRVIGLYYHHFKGRFAWSWG